MEQQPRDMQSCVIEDQVKDVQKRTIVVEFLDNYQARTRDFLSFFSQYGGIGSIEALGNVQSPRIWHITFSTQRKAENIIESILLPVEISGHKALISPLLNQLNIAQLQWVPFYLHSNDIAKTLCHHMNDFLIRRLWHTEDEFHTVYDTSYYIFSTENMKRLPPFLEIKFHDSTIKVKVEVPGKINDDEVIYAKVPDLPRKIVYRPQSRQEEDDWNAGTLL